MKEKLKKIHFKYSALIYLLTREKPKNKNCECIHMFLSVKLSLTYPCFNTMDNREAFEAYIETSAVNTSYAITL